MIIVDKNLVFDTHINVKSALAIRRCKQLLSVFPHATIDTYSRLFTTYIRPILEYGSEIISPNYSSQLCKQLERPQRLFSKIICSRNNTSGSYRCRLSVMKLDPLFVRRRRTDLITFFKIVTHQFAFNYSKFLTLKSQVSRMPCRPHRYVIRKTRMKFRDKHWFFARIFDYVNKLPPKMNSCQNLEQIVQVIEDSKELYVNPQPTFFN